MRTARELLRACCDQAFVLRRRHSRSYERSYEPADLIKSHPKVTLAIKRQYLRAGRDHPHRLDSRLLCTKARGCMHIEQTSEQYLKRHHLHVYLTDLLRWVATNSSCSLSAVLCLEGMSMILSGS